MKYVRFTNLKQPENEKLDELIDMVQHSLPLQPSNIDSNLNRPITSAQLESSVPTSVVKDNKSTLEINKNSLMHDNQPVDLKPIVKKVEKQDITLKSSPVLR